MSALDPQPEIIRYEKDTPGEMIHIDIKKLGRIDGIGQRMTGDRSGQSNARSRKDGGKGWEYLHLAVDEHSRLAYSEIFPDETRKSCLTSLFNALRLLRSHRVKVWRVMTDNGVSFRSNRYAKALRLLGIKQKTNKALHSQDQRKGRTLRPDLAALMGLCKSLRALRPAQGSPQTLSAPLQPPPSTLRDQQQIPHLEDSKQQPVET